MLRVLHVFLFTLALLVAPAAHAQLIGGQEPLTVALSPEFPRPGDRVVASVSSLILDLNSASITFYLDGVKIETTEAKRASFTVGGAGTRSTLTVEAVIDGQTYMQKVLLYPAEVSLILEPLSTVPPFYKGAALVAPAGEIRIVAIPTLRTLTGETIPAKDLVYSWKQGVRQLTEFSGIGRSVLSASAPVLYRGADVSVTVRDQSSTLIAQASIPVSSVSPYLRVYPRDPLMGTFYERAIGDTYTLGTTEESFRAVPYYFGTFPALTWTVTGQGSSQGQDITVRREGDGDGRASLSITALEETSTTAASKAFVVLFKKLTSGTIFGI